MLEEYTNLQTSNLCNYKMFAMRVLTVLATDSTDFLQVSVLHAFMALRDGRNETLTFLERQRSLI